MLILSARDGVQDRVKGLDLGADDYLPKPFSLEELLARVRSLVRRQSAVKQVVLEHAGIKLDLLSHTVHVNGQPIDLTSREYALLEVFMQNQGRILPRTLISEKIWASHYDVDTNLLDVYMSRLRSKLERPASRCSRRFAESATSSSEHGAAGRARPRPRPGLTCPGAPARMRPATRAAAGSARGRGSLADRRGSARSAGTPRSSGSAACREPCWC